jgi:hypothetical protein
MNLLLGTTSLPRTSVTICTTVVLRYATESNKGTPGCRNICPQILNSKAYRDGGVVFITWDEAEKADGPIGMIVLSPLAKGHGYENSVRYDHGSALRTFEEILGVTPYLGEAANQTDLRDLFSVFP